MLDYHVHSNYSFDAKGSIDEYCQQAVMKGLKEIAFTTHVDTDPETRDCVISVRGRIVDVHSKEWIEDYEQTIRSAGDKYAEQGLTVLMGAELDIYPGVASILSESFLNAEWDIVLGSMHLIDHLALSIRSEAEIVYSKYSLEELGNHYFSNLRDTVETSIVNILGHLDLYRRFGESYYGWEIFELWKPHIKTLASKMKKHNVGFEINTSSWRKGQKQPLPAPDIITALVDNGIETVTIGSDAHRPEDVGEGYERARDLLMKCGQIRPSTFRSGNVAGRFSIE